MNYALRETTKSIFLAVIICAILAFIVVIIDNSVPDTFIQQDYIINVNYNYTVPDNQEIRYHVYYIDPVNNLEKHVISVCNIDSDSVLYIKINVYENNTLITTATSTPKNTFGYQTYFGEIILPLHNDTKRYTYDIEVVEVI